MKQNIVLSLISGGTFLLLVTACGPDGLAPVAFAGNDQVVVPPDNKTELNGNATDADGTIVRYEWTMVSGPAPSILVDPSAAATRVEGLVAGTYVFQLRVIDDEGLSATDQVSIWVGDPCNGCWDY